LGPRGRCWSRNVWSILKSYVRKVPLFDERLEDDLQDIPVLVEKLEDNLPDVPIPDEKLEYDLQDYLYLVRS
jgi:hypothetical protein